MENVRNSVLKLCGGNPGCIRVATEIALSLDGAARVSKLLDLGYRSSQIWLIYKDLLGNDLKRMVELLDTDQLADEIERKIREDEHFARDWNAESRG